MLPIAIITGGLATRLGALTAAVPKALLPVAGEPFIHHQLRLLARAGFTRVVLCTGHLGGLIRSTVGTGAQFGLSIDYSDDGPTLRGTAGALRNALPKLGDAFFAIYGDSYLPCDYAAVERRFLDGPEPALMTVFRNQGQWDSSNIEFESGRILAYDKRRPSPRMHHIDYGVGAFRASVFNDYPGASDLADVYRSLLEHRQLAAFEVPERFYEIGSVAGLEELCQHLAQR